MPIEPIDITGLIAVILGISIVLIPVMGLTARFALHPVVTTLARMFEHRAMGDTVELLERRMALLEQHVESLDGSVHRMAEVSDFHRKLEAGEPDASAEPGGPVVEAP